MEINQPKRILALDGGGIRGALTLGFLERLERIIREKENNKDLLLCDYFDLIGGTSTGAIIAAGLSIGKTAGEIKNLYLSIGEKIFGQKNHWYINPIKWYKASYSFEPLENALEDFFGDITMGSDKIKTGLCIITKRADTFSTWPILNNPNGKYFKYNKNMMLHKVVRASAAAPTYFKPKQIDVGGGQIATFIDGGLSLANNPAFQLFLIGTLKGFPYRWPLGEDKITLVSVGTGSSKKYIDANKVAKFGLADWAKEIPNMLMEDANYFNQTVLQYLSNSPTAVHIDNEIGDLQDDVLTDNPAMHYLRYNVMLEENELNGLGMHFSLDEIKSLQKMDAAENKNKLYEIGAKAAAKYMKAEHIK